MNSFSTRSLRALAILAFSVAAAHAQESAAPEVSKQSVAEPSKPADPSKPAPSPQDPSTPVDKRVFGVLPNYRTVNETGTYTPISPKYKMTIAAKDSFDYPLVLLAGTFAGLNQLTDSAPSFGQGVKGYAHRLATNYADQAIGNMLTEGILPTILHEDPRYRRIGPSGGSKGHRTWYALSRVFVTRTDSGGTRFNYSEWAGNAAGVAISNSYYPDNRNFTDNATKLLTQVGTDAVSQVLKEFWPDIKQKFFKKKSDN